MKRVMKYFVILLVIGICFSGCGNNEAPSEVTADNVQTSNTVDEVASTVSGDETVDTKNGKNTEIPDDPQPSAEMPVAEEEAVDYDSLIKEHYSNKKGYERQITAIILAELEQASYIELPEELDTNYRKMITDALVADTIEGPIVSAGVKSAVDAICEGKSVEEIIAETTSGMISESQNYVEATLKDMMLGDVSKLLDCELFGTVSWINEFFNVDDTPIGLLEGMVGRQSEDIGMLVGIVNSEEMTEADLLYASAIYGRICERQKEIIGAGGQVKELGQQETIDKLIEEWKKENVTLYAYSKLMEGDYTQEKEDISALAGIRDSKLQELPVCYDVEAYREQQKATQQAGMVGGKIFGDFVGAGMTDDLELSQRSVQENRTNFYKILETSLEESYYQLCVSKGAFEELYDLASIEIEEIPKEYSFIDYSELYIALEKYIDALMKYTDDFSNAKMFWENTLSDKETAFINNMNTQIQDAYAILNTGLSVGVPCCGYDAEVEKERYVSLMDSYIDYLNWSMIYSNQETTFSGVPNITAYGVGNFNVYCKGMESIPIILAEEQLETNWHAQRYLWIYDVNGQPIYISNRYGKVYVKNSIVIHYDDGGAGHNENFAFTIYNTAVRMLEDLNSGKIEREYKNYALQ